jgi:hypothetical protein
MVVIRRVLSSRPNSKALRMTSRSAMWRLPPFSSGPHISKVLASKATEPVGSILVSGPNATYSVPLTSRTTLRCVTWTPFGVPVVPEV